MLLLLHKTLKGSRNIQGFNPDTSSLVRFKSFSKLCKNCSCSSSQAIMVVNLCSDVHADICFCSEFRIYIYMLWDIF